MSLKMLIRRWRSTTTSSPETTFQPSCTSTPERPISQPTEEKVRRHFRRRSSGWQKRRQASAETQDPVCLQRGHPVGEEGSGEHWACRERDGESERPQHSGATAIPAATCAATTTATRGPEKARSRRRHSSSDTEGSGSRDRRRRRRYSADRSGDWREDTARRGGGRGGRRGRDRGCRERCVCRWEEDSESEPPHKRPRQPGRSAESLGRRPVSPDRSNHRGPEELQGEAEHTTTWASPVLLLKGQGNTLKCWRYRCNKKWRHLFTTISTTFSWVGDGCDRLGRCRMLVAFDSEGQRKDFLKEVTLPKGVDWTLGCLDGL
ncbi:MAG: E8^E2 protein [Varecia variegata papillomavirus 1]|nr:MAG: E8^E2 protein [Varecia variegata papillomavirus 1]